MASDIKELLKKAVVGTSPQGGAMIFETGAPLDDRFVVRHKAALISESAFTSIGYLYQGLVCTDESTGDVYVLTDAPSASNNFLKKDEWYEGKTDAAIVSEIEKHWKKLAFAADINSSLNQLSGVFKFKGVAEAISPNQSIITIKSVSTLPVRDRNGKITKPSESLYCVTTAYEFDMDVYYGWGTSLNDIRFWTDTTTVNNNTDQYDKGEETSIKAYEFNGKLYYPTGTEQKYESIDEDIVYIKDNKVYETQDFTKTSIGAATEVAYTGCEFSVKSSPIALQNTTSETIAASPDNSGHVYQIGENEYASNGQIWVKLGSPVEDWIIL